ncbi:hypothetical protein AJ79_02129 [Helicocarpus griseus UAMH5409]|uniref:NAD-dependent epimerase/dehydratase domain-containing protein n=1 Tax=Helicocarpus griseus UAMH5409 TaxID=1447875 RepID=A0A2B7Y515_9EURO|nr:hypothetical protein AJ79_02129 [Helicocarpus griseus UAMH5409]
MTVLSENLAIPRGVLVVVTGANGYIASHVADQLLRANYRVRGTVRNLSKNQWLTEYFTNKYGAGKFELVEVPNMGVPHAYDEAVKGASGLVHLATPTFQMYDPAESIPLVTDGTINTLEAAQQEPLMKRVVLTSSSAAAANAQPNVEFTIDEGTWNEKAIRAVWAKTQDISEHRMNIYSASKAQAEKAAWKWMIEKQPNFVLNTVLPNVNFGSALCPEHQGYPSTVMWVRAVWDGFRANHGDGVSIPPRVIPLQWFVDVVDDALVHVAALIYKDVRAERLFAYAETYSWNDILAALRKAHPERQFIEDIPDLGTDLSKVTNQGAEDLLKKIAGRGWMGLEETIRKMTADWV